MRLSLHDLQGCFEGVIPALVATSSLEGKPNVSYLSHVAAVDDDHIGLSNQFFSKTSTNLRVNPKAMILVVDGRLGAQFMLQAVYVGARSDGPVFERLAAQVTASSVHVGLSGVMRLRCVDVFKVLAIEAVQGAGDVVVDLAASRSTLASAARVCAAIMQETEAGAIVDATLAGLQRELGISHALLLQHDPVRAQLSTIGSIGYRAGGIGSDVPLGQGVIGVAGQSGQTVKINEISRAARLSAAVSSADDIADENTTRTISLPGLADALSQIAVPLIVRGVLHGVLFAESVQRLAFSREDEAAFVIIARQAGAALALAESLPPEGLAAAPAETLPAPHGALIELRYYPVDDSVFIDGNYVIKGIAGRLLHHMVAQYLEDGRRLFSNRQIRLDPALGLPDVKSNLETRLLLLRRRLEDKAFPIRLQQAGRGLLSLQCEGPVVLTIAGAQGLSPGVRP